MEELAIYVHIPFCESKCLYCNFYSVTDRSIVREYVEKLKEEIDFFSTKLKDKKVKSIYFGGGTPSCIEDKYIKEIIQKIKESFIVKDNLEISIECNPNTINREKIENYLSYSINRFSIGLQSTKDTLLKNINRRHTIKEALSALDTFKELNVNNLSLDYILGLEGQDKEDVDSFLDILKRYSISHVSAYSLILEEHTPLYVKVKNGKYIPLDDDKQVDLYDYLLKGLEKLNIYRYETSSFSKRGYECVHNKCYWDYTDYLGIGVKAHSKIQDYRFSYEKNIKEYILEEDFKNVFTFEKLSREDKIFEYVMLSLRTRYGVDRKRFFNLFNEDFLSIFKHKLDNVKIKDCFEITDTYVKVKESKQYVLNAILGELLY